MVYVQLSTDWTDEDGVNHSAGEMVDVDAATLAQLQAEGVVAESTDTKDSTTWAGPGGTTNWAGPGSATA